QQMGPRVEQGVEARVVAPYRLVALGRGDHGYELRALQIEEPVLQAGREGRRTELDEHGASRRRRGRGPGLSRRSGEGDERQARQARVRDGLAAHEAAVNDVVEEVLAPQVHGGQV